MDDAMENMPQSALNMQQSAQGAPVRLRKTAPKRKPKPSLLTSTLDEFLVRITSTSEGRRSSSPEPQEQHLPPKIEPFCIIRSLRNQQKHGRCTAFGRAARQYSANSKYKEVGRVNLDPNLDRSHLSAMQLNADGSLLAVTMDLGIVAVYELSALRPGFAGASGIPVIQVMFERSVRTMTRLAWDPLAPNWVYTFGARGTSIDGFDVSKDKEHEPLEAVTCAYRNSAQRMLGCPGDLPRYSAIDFFKIEGPHLIAAAGSDGAVALWDKRVHSRSCSKLQGPQRTGALLSVQVAPDGRAVIAGSECGQVLMWDVRGGRAPTAQLGAYGPARHPLLASVKLKNSLAAVRGLTHQTYLPVTAVRSLTLDPCDPRRAAFSLHCGWHGVLDLVSQQVTHLYCPWEDPQSLSARDHHRLPAWGPNGGPYCFSTISGVTLLDFGSGRASPCAVSGPESYSGRLPSSVKIPTTLQPTTVAVHPHTQEIITANASDCSLLLLDRAGVAESQEPG